jgi:hypothetical protein
MKKRLAAIGGLGTLAGLLIAGAWYVADACANLAFRTDTDKNLISKFIENKISKD